MPSRNPLSPSRPSPSDFILPISTPFPPPPPHLSISTSPPFHLHHHFFFLSISVIRILPISTLTTPASHIVPDATYSISLRHTHPLYLHTYNSGFTYRARRDLLNIHPSYHFVSVPHLLASASTSRRCLLNLGWYTIIHTSPICQRLLIYRSSSNTNLPRREIQTRTACTQLRHLSTPAYRQGGFYGHQGIKQVRVMEPQLEERRTAFAKALEDDQWEDVDVVPQEPRVDAGTDQSHLRHTYGDVPDGFEHAPRLPEYDTLEPFQEMYELMESAHLSKPFKKKQARDNRQNRKKYAHNWSKAMPDLVEVYLTKTRGCTPDSCPKCTIQGAKSLSIWFIGFSCFEKRNFETCRCTKAITALVSLGFFPSSAIRPVFAFSMEMLDIFD
jgi:hypothetical protein